MSLEDTLTRYPNFYTGYLARNKMKQDEMSADLGQAHAGMGILAQITQQQQAAQLRDALAKSDGDVDKALAAAISTGNLAGAHLLAPLVKMANERKIAEQTRDAMREINGLPPANAVAPPVGTPPPAGAQPVPLGLDQPAGGAEPAPAISAAAPPSASDARKERIDKLNKMSVQYANNPIVSQRIQSEIDRLITIKPLIEHNFSVGENMVQPHMSDDNGKTWKPIPGSQPSAKFGSQVLNVNAGDSANKPLTDMAKLNADLKAGRITQEQFDSASNKKLGDPNAVLTPEAISAAAARYRIDGTLPPNMGRGIQGTVNTAMILKEAASSAAKDGVSPEAQRLNQVANRASAQALGQLTKQKNLILAFEKTAQTNANLVLQESEKVDRLGSPAIDRWIQAGQSNILGDVAVARLDTAVRTFVNEYARVTTSVTGGGITSDTARREIETLLRAAHTKEQVKGVIDLMKTELGNRKLAYDAQESELKKTITTGAPAKAPSAAPSTGTVLKFDASGKLVQ